MPSQNPFLVALRGDEAYARYLDKLLKTLRAEGVQVETRHQLGEYALTVLGLQHGMKAPARAKKHGTNQHGPPKNDSQ